MVKVLFKSHQWINNCYFSNCPARCLVLCKTGRPVVSILWLGKRASLKSNQTQCNTGWPVVSILWLGEVASLICSFHLSALAHQTLKADPSLKELTDEPSELNGLRGCGDMVLKQTIWLSKHTSETALAKQLKLTIRNTSKPIQSGWQPTSSHSTIGIFAYSVFEMWHFPIQKQNFWLIYSKLMEGYGIWQAWATEINTSDKKR